MLVYGDPATNVPLPHLLQRIRARITSPGAALDLDGIRHLLTLAGQLEQGAEDSLPHMVSSAEAERILPGIRRITDVAAAWFHDVWTVAAGKNHAETRLDPATCASVLSDIIEDMPPLLQAPVSVKIPEGFAFYTLFPEQYCVAALRWLHHHPEPRGRIAVVGIRSIGTTLSAVVAATLAARGLDVHRTTTRPTGHPFERAVDRWSVPLRDPAWALVIDEGPGLSGSSMAAAADALVRAGLDRSRISFLPGHDHPPGAAACESVRAWWRTTPRYVARLDELRWNGLSLPEILAEQTRRLLEADVPVERVDDCSAGRWREHVYASPDEWPAVCAAFERTKYRCRLADGRSVLWKFIGLAGPADADADPVRPAFETLQARARTGWTTPALGASLGFLATPWMEGTPLTRSDVTPRLLSHIGRYIAGTATRPLGGTQQRDALRRLREIACCNIREAFSDADIPHLLRLYEHAATQISDSLPSCGDGRLAPHEWLRTPDAAILKTDALAHDCDHTAVGPQPLAWDIAGALVEWGIESCESDLLTPIVELHGRAVLESLPLTRVSYAAFRLGQCRLCAEMKSGDPAEQRRLRRAAESYAADIRRTLTSS